MYVPIGSGNPAGFVVLVIWFKGHMVKVIWLELFKKVFLFPFFGGFYGNIDPRGFKSSLVIGLQRQSHIHGNHRRPSRRENTPDPELKGSVYG